ncbi:hypothetical protein AB1L88_15680 [Tautonia sp. JC769]|uniref:hypothetical protein n=1 Tax=Tautonia sp. JC769 TaxID=3232135 RepID=UPI00345B18E1
MGTWDGLFCTDEDIAIEASNDWPLLFAEPILAIGRDGAVAAASPWVLASPSNDFEAQGVAPGHLCFLSDLGDVADGAVPYRDQLLAVAAVAGSIMTLRPLGSSGGGVPPGLLGDLASVRFQVSTARPRIDRATDSIARHLQFRGLGPSVAGLDLRRACVLKVLCQRCRDLSRLIVSEERSQWAEKARMYCEAADAELGAVLASQASRPARARPAFGIQEDDFTGRPREFWEKGGNLGW